MPAKFVAFMLVSALLVVGVQGTTPVDAVAPRDSKPVLKGPNVVYYGQGYDVRDPEWIIRQGSRFKDGCQYTLPEPPVTTDTIEIETQYDPDTCRSVFVIGGPTDDMGSGIRSEEVSSDPALFPPGEATVEPIRLDPPDLKTEGLDALDEIVAPPPPIIDPRDNPPYKEKWAYSWTWYDEPARWLFGCDVSTACTLPPVNYVRNVIHWTPGKHPKKGECAIYPGTTGFVAEVWYYLKETGWKQVHHDWDHTPTLTTCDSPVWSNSYFTFRNAAFCQDLAGLLDALIGLIIDIDTPATTYTLYNPNGITGYSNGGSNPTSNPAKWGGCESFLRLGHRWGPGTGT